MNSNKNRNIHPALTRAGVLLALVVPLLGACGGGGGDAPATADTSATTQSTGTGSSTTTTSGSVPKVTNGFEVWDFNYTSNDGKTGKMCIRFMSGSDTQPPIFMSALFFDGYQEAGDLSGTVDAAGNVSMSSTTFGATFTATVDAAATAMSGTFTGAGPVGSGSFSGGRVMGKYACFWGSFGNQAVLDVVAANNARLPALAMDGDKPVVAFVEEVWGAPVNGIIPVERRIYVKRWTGTQWQQLGGVLNIDANNIVSQPRLAVANGQPVVAWSELNKTTQVEEAYAKRWDGAQWVQLGGLLNVSPTQNTYARGVVIDGNDWPVVMLSYYDAAWQLWITRGMQWSGSVWTQLGGNMWGSVLHLTQDATGAPAYVSADGLTLGAGKWNAVSAAWEGLGNGSILGGNNQAELAFTGSGAPVIASWGSGIEGFDVNTVGADGFWTALIPGLAYDPVYARVSPHIATDPTDGRVVVAALRGDGRDVIVQKAYTDRWKQVGGQLDYVYVFSAKSPVLAFDSAGKLYAVSSQELSSGNSNIVIRTWPSQN